MADGGFDDLRDLSCVAMAEHLYQQTFFAPSELKHMWGDHVHLLDDPMALTFLARLCAPETGQPDFNRLLQKLYQHLTWVVLASEFPRCKLASPTRMASSHHQAIYHGLGLDPRQKAVTVGVARAGTLPSLIVYDTLNEVLEPKGVRQDHVVMSRLTNEHGRVTGVSFQGAKTGSDISDTIVLLPDPMGATGSTVVDVIRHYTSNLQGKPIKFVVMHLIVTPEYLRTVREAWPELIVYALRYDRGLSPEEVFRTMPGEDPRERGLDDHQYIVPGAGGIGEILNNTWI